MNAPENTPMKAVTIPALLPAQIVLPVVTQADGSVAASNGVVWQKFMDYGQLEALGLRVVWQDAAGVEVSREAALANIEAQREAAMLAQHGALAANDPS